jgi:AP2 domain
VICKITGCERPKFALGICSRHYSRQRRGVTELASPPQDAAGLNRNNTSGARGVHWCSVRRRWRVSPRQDGTRFYGGTFSEEQLEEACEAARKPASQIEREERER